MGIELKHFSVHLGSHNYGVEHCKHKFNGHLLSEPRDGVEGLDLPLISFMAKDMDGAQEFVKGVNWLAVMYNMDAFDIARLVNLADKLTG